jgi:hypothetical protein
MLHLQNAMKRHSGNSVGLWLAYLRCLSWYVYIHLLCIANVSLCFLPLGLYVGKHSHFFMMWTYNTVCFLCHRLNGKIATKKTMAVVVSCLWMEQTLASSNQVLFVQNGFLTKSMAQACAMRLPYVYRRVNQCGSTALSLVVAGLIWELHATHSSTHWMRESITWPMVDTEMEVSTVLHRRDSTCSMIDKSQSCVLVMKTLNKRYKDWGALRQLYRHNCVSHSKVFRAIANIVQVTIMNGEPLFEVEYNH